MKKCKRKDTGHTDDMDRLNNEDDDNNSSLS